MDELTNLPLLVVDDDKAIGKLLQRIAERAGFTVDWAKDGVEALEYLEKKEYIIAIVDLMMPRLSGYELVQRISMLKPRPIVLVATAMANGDVASLDDSMVRRVIRKPFDIGVVADALVETAKQVLAQRAAAETPVPVAPPEIAVLPVVPPAEIIDAVIEAKPVEEDEIPPPTRTATPEES